MRHHVWLNTAPERAEGDKSKAPAKTRLQRMRAAAGDEGFEPDMPPPGAAEYLIAHLWAAGPTLGDNPLSSTELRHYQENMGIRLSPWECKTLRRLSIEYLNESHKAAKPDCPPPFEDGAYIAAKLKREDMRRNLRAFLDI